MNNMAQTELAFKGYTGSIVVSMEDACLHGRMLFIDDLVTYEGNSVPGLQAAFEAAVDRYLAHCERVGKSANKPFSGTFNVRIGSELHGQAARAASRKSIKLNEFVKQAMQAAIAGDGIITHEHRHQHNVNVQVDDGSMKMTVVAGMRTPSWENPNAKTH